jgi:hypothetical protein
MQMMFWYKVERVIRGWLLQAWDHSVGDDNLFNKWLTRTMICFTALPWIFIVALKFIERAMYHVRGIGANIPFVGKYITLPIDLAYMLFHVGLIFHVLKTFGIV